MSESRVKLLSVDKYIRVYALLTSAGKKTTRFFLEVDKKNSVQEINPLICV